eukprot:SAG22_NODE_7475_length_736_cov_0.890110_1_plen_80_part_01
MASWDWNGYDGIIRAVLGDVLRGREAARIQNTMLVAARDHPHTAIGFVSTIDGGPDVNDGCVGRKGARARRNVLMPWQWG